MTAGRAHSGGGTYLAAKISAGAASHGGLGLVTSVISWTRGPGPGPTALRKAHRDGHRDDLQLRVGVPALPGPLARAGSLTESIMMMPSSLLVRLAREPFKFSASQAVAQLYLNLNRLPVLSAW